MPFLKNINNEKNKEYVYTEAIIVTILSLVAASLWIDWTKQFIYGHFPNNPSALFACALAISLLAMFGLQVIFR